MHTVKREVAYRLHKDRAFHELLAVAGSSTAAQIAQLKISSHLTQDLASKVNAQQNNRSLL
jgi:hypothetical protein